MQKTIKWIITGIISLNIIAIIASFFMGRSMNDVSFFFQERQAITFLSAMQLAIAAVISIIVYSMKRIFSEKPFSFKAQISIWFIGFFVLAFAVADEYFMIHEGIDGDIMTFFFGIKDNPQLDGITLALYGVGAFLLFLKFKFEILKYKKAIGFFVLCGIFFLTSITLDLKNVDAFQIFLEESAKLIAVSCLLSGFVCLVNDVMHELAE